MGEDLPQLPEARPDDPEDVVWGLQTATTLWARGERREALTWVRRAAEAAGEAGADMRAVELAKHAVTLEEQLAKLDAGAQASAATAPAAAPGVAPPAPPNLISFPETRTMPPDKVPGPPGVPVIKAARAPSLIEEEVIEERLSSPLLIPDEEEDEPAEKTPPVPTSVPTEGTGPLSARKPVPPAPISAPQNPVVIEKQPAPGRPLSKPPPPMAQRQRSATLQPGVLAALSMTPPTPAVTSAQTPAPPSTSPVTQAIAPPPAAGAIAAGGLSLVTAEPRSSGPKKKQRAPILDPWADDFPVDEPPKPRQLHGITDLGPSTEDDIVTSAAPLETTLRRHKPPPPPAARPRPPTAPEAQAEGDSARPVNGEPQRAAPPPPRKGTLGGQPAPVPSSPQTATAPTVPLPGAPAATPATEAPQAAVAAGPGPTAQAAPAPSPEPPAVAPPPPPAPPLAAAVVAPPAPTPPSTGAKPAAPAPIQTAPTLVSPGAQKLDGTPRTQPPPAPRVAATTVTVTGPTSARSVPPAPPPASAAAPPATPAQAPAPPPAQAPAPAQAAAQAPAHATPVTPAQAPAAAPAPAAPVAPAAAPPRAASTPPRPGSTPPGERDSGKTEAAPPPSEARSVKAPPPPAVPRELDASRAPASKAAPAQPPAEKTAPASAKKEAPKQGTVPPEQRELAGLPLERVEGLGDLPGEIQQQLAQLATILELGETEEHQGFGALVVVSGAVDVCATIADIPAASVAVAGIIPAVTSITDVVSLRAVATARAKVATWSKQQLEDSLKSCPWVLEELVRVGDRLAALAGVTMGPLGDLDDDSRRQTLDRFRVKVLRPGEAYAKRGEENLGLAVVGGGLVLVGTESPKTLEVGDLVFPDLVLAGSPAPDDATAGDQGALLLVAPRASTVELFSTNPMLLELLR